MNVKTKKEKEKKEEKKPKKKKMKEEKKNEEKKKKKKKKRRAGKPMSATFPFQNGLFQRCVWLTSIDFKAFLEICGMFAPPAIKVQSSLMQNM